MKISHNWLKDLLPHTFTTDKIAEKLTDIGLEVEGIHIVESVKGGLKGVVIGEVLTCERHPNADRLSITRVNIGTEPDLSIVCGAPNVAAGQKVLVATIGTELYGDDGIPFIIKEAKVRGELSQGMICAEDELGLGNSHEGIMVLPEGTVVGSLAADYFNIESDEVIEIGLTPNRADANSHYGTARDLWASLHIHENYNIPLAEPEILNTNGLANSQYKVTIENKEACRRYTGILIENITVGSSPDWLRRRLESIGQRPVNIIVDITNYVMFELGQPLHAFDADKIRSKHIIVQNLPHDTSFLTLDGNIKSLDKEDLVICDGDGHPMCLAGVYGGKESGVTVETKNIFLESASFNPASVRRTSFRHNLRTESASHFEKGTDPEQCLQGLLRAAILIKNNTECIIRTQVIDIYPEPSQPVVARIDLNKIRSHIGKEISNIEIQDILESLGMSIEKLEENNWNVTIPSHKTDVTRQADIIEEIVRIYGLNNIEAAEKFSFAMPEAPSDQSMPLRQTAFQYLSDAGYSEAMGLSIINSNNWVRTTGEVAFEGIRINNTSNVQLDLMRPDPIATALEIVAYNQSRQQTDLRMFEYGRTYNVDEQKSYIEEEYISIFGTGYLWDESWKVSTRNPFDSFFAKTTVLNLFKRLNISKFQEKSVSEDFRLNESLEFWSGSSKLAVIGEIKASLLKNAGIKGNMTFCHLYWNNLLENVNIKPIKFKEFSRFPVVRRDLALIVNNSVKYEEIRNLAQKSCSPFLSNIKLFDIYTHDDQLGKDKKSLSVAFYFTNPLKTFDEQEIDGLMKKLIDTFQSKLDAFIRK